MQLLRTEVIVFFILTIVFSVYDCKSRSVPWWLVAVSALTGLGFCFFGKRGVLPVLAALTPGAFLLGLGFVTEGSVGLGDGLYLLTAGLFLTLAETLSLAAIALFLAFATALTVFVGGGRAKAKTKLPFLAFFPGAFLILGGIGL